MGRDLSDIGPYPDSARYIAPALHVVPPGPWLLRFNVHASRIWEMSAARWSWIDRRCTSRALSTKWHGSNPSPISVMRRGKRLAIILHSKKRAPGAGWRGRVCELFQRWGDDDARQGLSGWNDVEMTTHRWWARGCAHVSHQAGRHMQHRPVPSSGD